MNSEKYNEHAINFLKKYSKYYDHTFLIDVENDTFEYIKTQSDYKYKDDVEAGSLATCLVTLGFTKFVKKENNKKYFELTKKGSEYVKSVIESKI